jgi:hypothetical protein
MTIMAAVVLIALLYFCLKRRYLLLFNNSCELLLRCNIFKEILELPLLQNSCSETMLTRKSRLHVSTPHGIWTRVPCDGKQTGRWDCRHSSLRYFLRICSAEGGQTYFAVGKFGSRQCDRQTMRKLAAREMDNYAVGCFDAVVSSTVGQ